MYTHIYSTSSLAGRGPNPQLYTALFCVGKHELGYTLIATLLALLLWLFREERLVQETSMRTPMVAALSLAATHAFSAASLVSIAAAKPFSAASLAARAARVSASIAEYAAALADGGPTAFVARTDIEEFRACMPHVKHRACSSPSPAILVDPRGELAFLCAFNLQPESCKVSSIKMPLSYRVVMTRKNRKSRATCRWTRSLPHAEPGHARVSEWNCG